MPREPKLTQGHDLYKLCSTTDPDATYQVLKQLAQWFWRRRYFKVLSIFEHGGNIGHVTGTIYTNFCPPLPKEAPHKIWL